MELEEIRNKYQCDEGKTFAQWKEWVRKNKPSQAQAHIIKAVAPNGSKFEKLIGGYVDAQNIAFDLVSHGYKDVKVFHSINAGPLKLVRNFSAPLHGAKFKDSDVSTDAQDDKKFFFQVFTRNGKLISKIKAPDTISTSIATRLAEQESKKFKKNWFKCQIVDQNGHSYETYYNKVPSYNGTRELAQKNMDSCDSVDEICNKYQKDAAFGVKIQGNEKATERLTMEKVFKELSPAPAWKKVKKGNTIVIRTNINGKDKDVVTIKYFNPNVVAMTPRGGAANMVGLDRVSVMCNKLGVEGRRSYMDSVDSLDAVDGIRSKYQEDKLFITSKGFANENGLLKKDPRKGLKPFEVNFYFKGKDGKPFKSGRSKMAASLEEAKRWANQESRKYNGVTKIEVKEFKDDADCLDLKYRMNDCVYAEDAKERMFKNIMTNKVVTESEAKAISDKQKKKMNSWKIPWTREQLAEMSQFAIFVPVDIMK